MATERLLIKERHRQTLETLLREHLPDVEAWAYGSRVNGRGHAGSDLDLVLRGPELEEIPILKLDDFRIAVRESNIPFLVEARDWARLPERFHREIARDYVVLRNPARASASPWRATTFGDCAILVRNTVSPDDMGDMPYIGLEHIGEGTLGLTGMGIAKDVNSAKTLFSRDDILFGKLRPYFRKVVRASSDGICSTDIWVVRPSNGIDSRYLFYVMASNGFVDEAMRGAEGTRMPRAKWEFVSRIPVHIPPLPEQRAIARILGALDDKIELNRRMNETLEAMVQALFKSWFVDFEPVRAKMAGWDTGLPHDIAILFPQSFTTIDQRDVPLGWSVIPLGELIELNYGKALRKDKRILGDFPVLGSGGSNSSHVEPLVPHPTVVIGRKGTVGSIHWAPRGCWPIDTTYYVVSTADLPMTYIYRLLQHLPLTEMNTDAAVPGLNRLNAYRLGVPFASIELAYQFAALADPLQMRIDDNESQISILAALRDTLLPKLVSGEIRVPDAEKAVESVA